MAIRQLTDRVNEEVRLKTIAVLKVCLSREGLSPELLILFTQTLCKVVSANESPLEEAEVKDLTQLYLGLTKANYQNGFLGMNIVAHSSPLSVCDFKITGQ